MSSRLLDLISLLIAAAFVLTPLACASGARLDLSWVSAWQTLVTGVLAIVAAIVGGLFIWRQTQETIKIEAERLARSANGARAVLPLTLNTLIEWTEQVVHSLEPLLLSTSSPVLKKPIAYAVPGLPQDSVMTLRGVIESSDAAVGVSASRALARAQVVLARLGDLPINLSEPSNGHVVTKAEIESIVIEAARVKAELESLFDYARSELLERTAVHETADSLSSLVHRMGLSETTFPNIHETIQRRFS